MTAPRPFECGGQGQPACPPMPAVSKQENALNVLRWYHSLPEVHRVRIDALLGAQDESPEVAHG